MISSAPILKHQRFFLRELTYIQIIQPVPDDLGILAHYVSIYPLAPQCDNSCATLVHVQLRIHPATTWDLGKQNKNILDTVFDDSALKLSLKYEYL